jgi:hypothetical protein
MGHKNKKGRLHRDEYVFFATEMPAEQTTNDYWLGRRPEIHTRENKQPD